MFGPTLVAIAEKAAVGQAGPARPRDSKTYKRLGYDPISLDDGLQATTAWLREIGKVD